MRCLASGTSTKRIESDEDTDETASTEHQQSGRKETVRVVLRGEAMKYAILLRKALHPLSFIGE